MNNWYLKFNIIVLSLFSILFKENEFWEADSYMKKS